METTFTPISATLGGVFIGCATVMLWLSLGRIAGISGIFFGILEVRHLWRGLFLFGLVIGSAIVYFFNPSVFIDFGSFSPWKMLVGGTIVGIGTALSGGCTSGHGICGIARFSPRSLTATVLFMISAMITIYIMRHYIHG